MAKAAQKSGIVNAIVRCPAGVFRGVEQEGVRIFRGIAYALQPSGSNRWKPPSPVPSRSGVYDATHFGPACPQPPRRSGSIYASELAGKGEDCLSLNVWMPQDADGAPVFVWIHGGSLIWGGSSEPFYDGTELAKRGIVVVSFNYQAGDFRLSCASRAERRGARRHVRQLRTSGPDRRAGMGPKQHQGLWRRSGQGHRRRGIRRRAKRTLPDVRAAGARSLLEGDRAKCLCDFDAGSETGPLRRRTGGNGRGTDRAGSGCGRYRGPEGNGFSPARNCCGGSGFFAFGCRGRPTAASADRRDFRARRTGAGAVAGRVQQWRDPFAPVPGACRM